MPTAPSRESLWSLVHAERAALAGELAGLTAEQWARPSLCGRWTVEEVVAHLTAGASTGRWRWLRSMVAARFDDGVHNDRRLAEHRGATPSDTLERFRAIARSTTAPSGHTGAWLGEIVVHGEDVRRPLGLAGAPSVEAATGAARFLVSRDFTVASRTAVRGLRLEATDGGFAVGDGPLVRGRTVALVMAMAGRVAYLDDLAGAGVPTLRARVAR